jgi:hypothetical protein
MHAARIMFRTSAALAALVLLGWFMAGPDRQLTVTPGDPAAAAHQPSVGRPEGRERAWARAETDPVRRAALLRRKLESWVALAPEDACAWVLGLPDSDRLNAATALLIATADQPELASELTRQLCAADPTFIREHGTILLAVLVESGASDVALQFAARGGPESPVWLDCTFGLWAAHDPEQAARAALALPDGGGFSTVAGVWAEQDPAGLAEFAMEKLDGTSRTLALEDALGQWLIRDPAAVSEWLGRFEPTAELDAGVSALALLPALVHPHPDVALGWAAGIVDPALRIRTLARVATQWAEVNPFAARQYVAATGELTLVDRLDLLAVLDRPPRPPD